MSVAKEILEAAIASKPVALNIETKFSDSRSDGPAPSDFGEHEEIPDEAIVPVAVAVVDKVIEEKD